MHVNISLYIDKPNIISHQNILTTLNYVQLIVHIFINHGYFFIFILLGSGYTNTIPFKQIALGYLSVRLYNLNQIFTIYQSLSVLGNIFMFIYFFYEVYNRNLSKTYMQFLVIHVFRYTLPVN